MVNRQWLNDNWDQLEAQREVHQRRAGLVEALVTGAGVVAGIAGVRKAATESGFTTPTRAPSLRKRSRESIEPVDKHDQSAKFAESNKRFRANMEPAIEAKSASTTNKNNVAHETPVDRVNPYEVYRGPPDYTFTSLPYQYDAGIASENTYNRDHTFRMTSPYDCKVNDNSTDYNTGAGAMMHYTGKDEASDATDTPANWFNFYAGMYNFYHVVSCQYTVFIENWGTPLWVYFMHCNEEEPPKEATNMDMQLWSGVDYYYVNAPYAAVATTGSFALNTTIPTKDGEDAEMNDETGNTSQTNPGDSNMYNSGNHVATRSGTVTLTKYGEYRPGDFAREIRLDSEVETWTDVDRNPSLSERLIVRVKPQSNVIEGNSARNAGDDLHYRIRVQLNYLVEFKELKTGLRYPVKKQPITVTIDTTKTGRS